MTMSPVIWDTAVPTVTHWVGRSRTIQEEYDGKWDVGNNENKDAQYIASMLRIQVIESLEGYYISVFDLAKR
jgi:hypothetical protein